MSVIRVIHDKNYVVLHKAILEDPEISLRAKGLWAFCMGKPDNWEFHVSQLESTLKEGEKALRATIDELIQHGYMKKIQVKNEKGHWLPVDYEIFEQSDLKKCLPLRPKRQAVERQAVKEALLSNDITKEPYDKETTPPPTPSKGGQQAGDVAFSKPSKDRLKTERDKSDTLRSQFMRGLKDGDKVNRAIKFYHAYDGKFPSNVRDPVAWTINAIQTDRDLDPKGGLSMMEFHKKKALELRDFYKNRNDIYVYPDTLVFEITGAEAQKVFYFNEPKFVEMVKARLDLMGLTWAGIFE